MPNQVVQLIDNNNNNIYPVAGALKDGSVTTSTINDKAVTASKVDFSTFNNGLYVTRVVLDTPVGNYETRQVTTTKGNTLTLFSASEGSGIGVVDGGDDIIMMNTSSTFNLSSAATGDIGVMGMPSTETSATCGYRFANSASGEGINYEGTNNGNKQIGTTTIYYGTLLTTGGGGKRDISIKASWTREETDTSFWVCKWGYDTRGSISSFNGWTEVRSTNTSVVPTVYLQGISAGQMNFGKVILEIYEV